MSGVDITERLDEVEQRIIDWDFTGARDAVQALLDDPALADGDRLTARRLLAEVLRELSELDAAYDLADAVVKHAERAHGPNHPVTVHAVAVLAAVRHDYDEWDEAERLYHRVLDSGIDEEGDDPVCRAVRLARVNLALLQRDRGNRPLALTMLNAAYVLHRREYGADDLDTIRIAAELAALHHADGNMPAARRLFTLAHAAARARLGTRHPFTRAVEWELAAVEPPMPSHPDAVDLGAGAPEHADDAPVSPAQRQDRRAGNRTAERQTGERRPGGLRAEARRAGERSGAERPGGERSGSEDLAGGQRLGDQWPDDEELGDDRPNDERSSGERKTGERSGGERLGGERLGGERLGGKQPDGEGAGEARLGGERSGGERSGGERSGGEWLSGKQSGGERLGEAWPGEERSGGEWLSGKQPGGERLGEAWPGEERSSEDRLDADQPGGDEQAGELGKGEWRGQARRAGEPPADGDELSADDRWDEHWPDEDWPDEEDSGEQAEERPNGERREQRLWGDQQPEPQQWWEAESSAGKQPSADGSRGSSRPGRGVRLVVPVWGIAVVVVIALVVAGIAIWGGAPPADPPAAAGPTDSGAPSEQPPAVSDLKLQDRGTTLAVSWTGPQATVVVALSRAGAPAVVLGSVPPGTTEYVVRNVEPGVAYCVVVGPVDATQAMTPTTSVCTGAR